MAVSTRLRYEILRRDNHTCQYCGRTAPEVKLTVDHVVPKALGGSDDPSNLLTACSECNGGKSSSNPDAPLVAAADQRAAQWGQAMEIAVARRQSELANERERVASFDANWRRWGAGGNEIPRDPGWRNSILRFMAEGLDDAFLLDAIDIAMNSRVKARGTWPYFCGVCWTEVRKIQAIASGLSRGATETVDKGSRHERDEWTADWTDGEIEMHDEMMRTGRQDRAVQEAYLEVLRGVLARIGASPELLADIDTVTASTREAALSLFAGKVPSPADEQARERLALFVTRGLEPLRFPPPKPGESFAYMEMFESFLESLVIALGGDEETKRTASRILWDAMPEAHRVWRESLALPPSEDLAEDEEDYTANEMAQEEFESCIAYGMYHIGQRRKTQSGEAQD